MIPSKRASHRGKAPKHYGRLAKVGALWSFGVESAGQIIALPISMVLARLLSPPEFGVVVAGNFFVLLGRRLANLGLNAGIIRIKELREEHKSSVLVVNVLVGLLLYLCLFFAAPAIGAFYRSEETGQVVRVVGLTFLIHSFGSVSMALIRREMRFRAGATVILSADIAFGAVSIPLAMAGFSYWSLAYGHVAASLVTVASRIWLARWWPRTAFSWRELREVLSFGVGVHTKVMLEYAAQNVDSLVVGRTLGLTALGHYERAFNMVNRVMTRLTVGPGVSFRIFALIYDDPGRFRTAYSKVICAASLLAFPLFGALIVAAPQVIEVAYGPQWGSAVVPFQILCAAGALKLLNSYASSAIQAAGLVWSEVWRQSFTTAVMVIAILALTPWGIIGASVAVLAATVIGSVLMQDLVRRIAAMRWMDLLSAIAPSIICAVWVAAGILAADAVLHGLVARPLAAWERVLVQVPVGALLYTGYLLLVPAGRVRFIVHEFVTDFAPRFAGWFPLPPATATTPPAPVADHQPDASSSRVSDLERTL